MFFFFNDAATTEIYTRSLHDALPIFTTICNMVGDIEVTGQSEGIEKFLTTEETKENLESAAQAWLHARKTIAKKIGKGLYTLTAYEKLKRVTVPLEDGFLLLATMDNTCDQTQTIDGILKLVHNQDRKSTRLNSSHKPISYAVFCLKK